jgi:hypothetical protein
MVHRVGEKVARGVRRRAVRQLQYLVTVGASDDEAKAQIAEAFNVSDRTARTWMKIAYDEMTAASVVDRQKLVGMALRRRRLFMTRAVKEGDWKTALAAAESEAKLLGLNAPIQTEMNIVVTKIQDMTRVVVDVVREFFGDRTDECMRFIAALQAGLDAQLAARAAPPPLLIDAEIEEVAQVAQVDVGNVEPVGAPELPSDDVVAPGPAPADDIVPPADAVPPA